MKLGDVLKCPYCGNISFKASIEYDPEERCNIFGLTCLECGQGYIAFDLTPNTILEIERAYVEFELDKLKS